MRGAGLLAGVGIGVQLGPTMELSAGPPPLPLIVDASIVRSGEVGVRAGAHLLAGAEVRPGPDGTAQGWLELTSETSVPVLVTVQDVGLPTGLEEELWLRVTLGDVVVFEGPQTELRSRTSRPAALDPGVVVPIGITASLPPTAPDEHQGRRAELRLQLASPVDTAD